MFKWGMLRPVTKIPGGTFQRSASLALMAVLLASDLLLLLVLLSEGVNLVVTAIAAGTTALLLLAYIRGVEAARYGVVALYTALVGVAVSEPFLTQYPALIIVIPSVIAVVLADERWVAGSGVAVPLILVARARFVGVYTDPAILLLYAMVVAGLVLSRRTLGSAAQERQVSQDRFASAFRASPVGIAILSLPEGRFVDVNDAFVDLIGYTKEELLGKTAVEAGVLPSIPPEVEQKGKELARLPRIRDMPAKYPTKSGPSKDVRVSVEFIEAAGERQAIVLARDVSDELLLQQKLLDAERSASLGQLAGYLAHEINTPLTNISLLASSAKILTQDNRVVQRLDKILDQRRRISSLIEALLAISRSKTVEQEQVDLRFAVLDVME
ncbi:MAG: PAS domain S-box protein, partial [Thermoplasmata archaeon]|nr:PAS domain S-box protein [Thermoplasmata archaeon]